MKGIDKYRDEGSDNHHLNRIVANIACEIEISLNKYATPLNGIAKTPLYKPLSPYLLIYIL